MNKKLIIFLTIVLTLTMLSACESKNSNLEKEKPPVTENNSGNSASTEPNNTEDKDTSTTASSTEFPEPIGSYIVGRTQIDFKYTASNNLERELTALIFYPSDSNENKSTAEYAFPEFHTLRNELLAKLGAPTVDQLFDSNFKTWTYEDLALSKKEKQYPVLFFVHGAGAYPQQGTLFAQDLASSGYIVVSIGHAESGIYKLKDGRTMGMSEEFMLELTKYGMETATLTPPEAVTHKFKEEEALALSRSLTSAPEAVNFSKYALLQSEDVRYVADNLYKLNNGDIDSMFKERLKLDIGLGVFGHSFGGTTAAIVSRDDERFVGAVNLDGNMVGALDSDLKKPFLQVGTVLAYNTNAFLLETNSEDTYFAIVNDVIHGDFSDSMFTTTNQTSRGSRDAKEQRTIITSYTKGFFDRYLLHKEADIGGLTFNGVEMIKKP